MAVDWGHAARLKEFVMWTNCYHFREIESIFWFPRTTMEKGIQRIQQTPYWHRFMVNWSGWGEMRIIITDQVQWKVSNCNSKKLIGSSENFEGKCPWFGESLGLVPVPLNSGTEWNGDEYFEEIDQQDIFGEFENELWWNLGNATKTNIWPD